MEVYVRLKSEHINPGEVASTKTVKGTDIHIDYDRDGRVLGVEILGVPYDGVRYDGSPR